jgi:cation-transporting P-type ATPase 13A2
MLVKGQIYARMSPDEKHELVEKLQSIDYCVGFCGDGANDCGALKAADVGVSLSEAEASVAAPFTSRSFEISCVVQLIRYTVCLRSHFREGRAALVTSFSCFKYMALYSAIQFITVSILYRWGCNLGDFQFLLIDLFFILPIAVFSNALKNLANEVGWTGPYYKLSPKAPPSSLVSKSVIISIVGHIFVFTIVQLLTVHLVNNQSWYIPPIVNPEDPEIRNSENTVLFEISCYQYIMIAVILSVGPPYRQPMVENRPFIITIGIAALFTTIVILFPPSWLASVLQLTGISFSFAVLLVAIALGNFAISWFSEKVLFGQARRILDRIAAWKLGKQRQWKTKSKKRYQVVEAEF